MEEKSEVSSFDTDESFEPEEVKKTEDTNTTTTSPTKKRKDGKLTLNDEALKVNTDTKV